MPRPIKLGTLTDSGSTLTLQPSTVFIGGQQIRTTTLTAPLSGLTTGVRYYVYVVNTLTPQLVVSPNDNTAGPTGFTAWGLVGSFFPASATTVGYYLSDSRAALEVKTAVGGPYTPVGSDVWHALTGNSILLTPGVWECSGAANLFSSGNPAYGYVTTTFNTANGNNTGTDPGLTGVSVLGGRASVDKLLSSVQTWTDYPQITIFRITTPTVIYMNIYSRQTTNANSRIFFNFVAKKIE